MAIPEGCEERPPITRRATNAIEALGAIETGLENVLASIRGAQPETAADRLDPACLDDQVDVILGQATSLHHLVGELISRVGGQPGHPTPSNGANAELRAVPISPGAVGLAPMPYPVAPRHAPGRE